MWWLLAFASAAFLGGYDSFKKFSLKDNAVVPVLFLNTVLCALIFSPGLFLTGFGSWAVQQYIVAKSALVLSSWMAGYIAMKHLPLTIVGPVNATRPVLVLVGAIFLFGEQLNGLQWTGVALAIFAYFLMRHSSEKEGYRAGNKWILYLILSVLLGAASGLYDKYLMSPGYLGLDRMQVLSWYSFYQSIMMAVVMLLGWMPTRHSTGANRVAQAYRLLHTIMADAVRDEVVRHNPCVLKGASQVRAIERTPATLEQLDTIAANMPERYAALIHVAAWSGLRFSELAGLRRRDVLRLLIVLRAIRSRRLQRSLPTLATYGKCTTLRKSALERCQRANIAGDSSGSAERFPSCFSSRTS